MRTEQGIVNGKRYFLAYRPVDSILAVDFHRKVWHLELEGEYRGHFDTKREALAYAEDATYEPE